MSEQFFYLQSLGNGIAIEKLIQCFKILLQVLELFTTKDLIEV